MATEPEARHADAPPAGAAHRFSRSEAEARIRELQQLPVERLDVLFVAGTAPQFADVEGATAGGWLAKRRRYWWADLFIKVALDSPWARWSGKGFETPFAEGQTGRGVNLFTNRFLPRRYRLRTYVGHAVFDTKPCLTLEYPFGSVMWGLIDDVRQIEPGVLLGRMEFRFPWEKQRRFLGYFALCALEAE